MRTPFYIKLAAILICIVLGTIVLIYGKEFLLPVIIAGLFSFLLYPFCKKLELLKVPKILAVTISMLMVIVLFVLLAILISTQLSHLVSELNGLNAKMSIKLSATQNYLHTHLNVSNATLNQWIENGKANLLSYSGEFLSGTFAATTNFMSDLTLVAVYVFCFLLYRKSFKDFAFSLMGEDKHSGVTSLFHTIQKLAQNYLIGLFTVIMIIGTLNTIGLWIVGIDYAIFFGFLAALLTIIPYIGIFIGSLLPIAFALLTKDSAWSAVGVIAVFSIVQFAESNFITPKIVGSRVSINPFAAIVALLIGGQLWGAAGMILSIPLTAILKVIFDTQPSTKALGYFLGSELTDDKDDPSETFANNQKSD